VKNAAKIRLYHTGTVKTTNLGLGGKAGLYDMEGKKLPLKIMVKMTVKHACFRFGR
jgi:hypothetical protein